ncbi:hypothetical protein ARMSODRAFT_1090203 [Armillaria solidipes]|uniref:Uncharacterized protein n=1 Tax=Armillaria solidipes TaxID=1076256 RepID=A0A2H3B0M5_9AGAR|nr:hypothetical protein ARMSODRAFT_1090203 [Armillaria solidipes]
MTSTKTLLDDLLDRYTYISSITRSPQLSTLVNTNNAPLPFQAAQLKSLVADPSLKTSQVQYEIYVLEWATESLEEHASHLGAITRDYERALSPIHCLPGPCRDPHRDLSLDMRRLQHLQPISPLRVQRLRD